MCEHEDVPLVHGRILSEGPARLSRRDRMRACVSPVSAWQEGEVIAAYYRGEAPMRIAQRMGALRYGDRSVHSVLSRWKSRQRRKPGGRLNSLAYMFDSDYPGQGRFLHSPRVQTALWLMSEVEMERALGVV